MKKTANHVLTTLVVFLALMLLLMPSAFADGGRGVCETLPHGLPSGWKAPETDAAYEYAEMAEEASAAGTKAAGTKAGGLTVSVSQSGTIPGPMTWTASASGGNGSYSYEFKLYIPKLVDGVMWHYVKAQQAYSSSRVFHHTFTENGEYELAVNVKDSSGKTGSKILQISVHEEGMDPLTASFNAPSGAYFTTTTTWSMDVSGGDGNYSYMFWFYWEDAPIPMSVISGDDTYGPESAFHYRLLASGTYKLIGFVMDGNGQRAQDTIVFTAESPDYPSVPEIARRLAAQCVSAGCRTAYEKALWMHDWLIYHADYDHSFTHYGPDGVLCAGSGVCESYAFAYAYLMRELGSPCEFASAENHMWNMIQLDGEWYHVDTTWDDPTDASTGGGGLERHLYFCVPWEVIAVDHHNGSIYFYNQTCTSYRYNYYVMTGQAEAWADDLAALITQGLAAGDYRFSVQMPYWYTFEGDSVFWQEPEGVLASGAALHVCRQRNFSFGGQTVKIDGYVIDVNHFGIYRYVDFDNLGWICVSIDGKTLDLPSGVKRVNTDAFRSDPSFVAARVPDGATAIQNGAFQGCSGLWLAVIPASVTSIGNTAFDSSNPHLTIVAPEGSAAQQYAQSHGIKFLSEEFDYHVMFPEY